MCNVIVIALVISLSEELSDLFHMDQTSVQTSTAYGILATYRDKQFGRMKQAKKNNLMECGKMTLNLSGPTQVGNVVTQQDL